MSGVPRCSSTWTGNGVYLLAASSLQALSKAHRNSSSAAFEECLFPNQRVLLLGSSAQGLGLRGTRRCECPQRERVLTWESYGVEGMEGKRSPVLQNHVSSELMWRRRVS